MFTDTFKLSSEPMTGINKWVMGTYDSIVDAQMASFRGYMEQVENLTQSVATIHDLEGIKDFIADQPKRSNQLVKQMSEDLQKFAGLATEIRDEASQLFQSSIVVNAEEATTPKTNALPKNSPKKETATNS